MEMDGIGRVVAGARCGQGGQPMSSMHMHASSQQPATPPTGAGAPGANKLRAFPILNEATNPTKRMVASNFFLSMRPSV
jgi:hypothetical protein